MYQVPIAFVIGLDDNCYTEGINGPVCSPHPGDGFGKVFVPLNYAYVNME